MPREEHQRLRPARDKRELPAAPALDVGSRAGRSMTGRSERALADREEFFAALGAQYVPFQAEQRAQSLVDRFSEAFNGLLRQPVRPAQRLGNDAVDDTQ